MSMFSKLSRIDRNSFADVFRKAKVLRGKYVAIYFFPAKNNEVAIVVPKKVCKKAVTRHRYKRIVLGLLYKKLSEPESAKYKIIVRTLKTPPNETTYKDDLSEQLSLLS